MTLRRELVIVLGAVVIGWVLLMAGLAKWQRSASKDRVVVEPALIHYPGTESAPEQTVSSIDMRKYWFRLDEPYPSLSVYYFYKNRLQADGWRAVEQNAPTWIHRSDRGGTYDLFRATWIDPNGLFQLDLQMVSKMTVAKDRGGVGAEEREPGIEVFVTQQRVPLPGFVTPVRPPENTPERDQIQMK